MPVPMTMPMAPYGHPYAPYGAAPYGSMPSPYASVMPYGYPGMPGMFTYPSVAPGELS
jgi:hypothetical protein